MSERPITLQTIDIAEWATRIIEGTGGMNAKELYEWVIFHDSDRVAAAKWTLRCLANPECEGSAEVLQAIMERREKVAAPERMTAR